MDKSTKPQDGAAMKKTERRTRGRRKGEKGWVSSIWVDVGLIAVLVGSSVWIFQQFSSTYHNMQASLQTLQSISTQQADLAQGYKHDLILAKGKFYKAESLLKNVYTNLQMAQTDLDNTRTDLSKAQTKNNNLQQKIQLMDTVADLEDTVSGLKEKSDLLANHINSIKQESFTRAENIKTIQEGRTILSQYHDRLKKIKRRIGSLRHKARLARIDVQKEKDRIMTLAGNRGYILRNGEFSPSVIVLPVFGTGAEEIPSAIQIGSSKFPADKDVKIKVTFVNDSAK